MNESAKNEAKTYIAITIGPILRTFGLTATPAALWASSYLFSFISKNIRNGVIQHKECPVNPEMFIVPYVSQNNTILDRDDGLGLLHDHIIFQKPEGFNWQVLSKIIDSALEDANTRFAINDLDYLKQYITISAVEYEAENPIMGSSKMLDSLELATTFVPREDKNPILAFFTNDNTANETERKKRNEQIKNQGIGNEKDGKLGIHAASWQLLDRKGNVRDLGMIAQGGFLYSSMKKHCYYAVVRSDGDNMGKLISRLKTTNDFHVFSEACLTYCERVAGKVNEYQGMTVYAGGDDLLAILPCENSDGKNVFDFVREANQVFHSIFLDEKQPIAQIMQSINAQIEKENKEKGKNTKTLPPPSLTWGVTLCHRKYPLYEALEDSANLLFGAKRLDYKDAVNLRLIKHSGQTSAVYIKNELLTDENGTFFSLLNDILARPAKQAAAPETADAQEGQNAEEDKKEEENDDILLSCLHTFHEARAVFRLADDQNTENLFINMFDADAHENNRFLHDSLPRLYRNYCLNGDICALDDDGKKVMLGEKGNQTPDAPEALHYLLRILKFFVEKAGEKE